MTKTHFKVSEYESFQQHERFRDSHCVRVTKKDWDVTKVIEKGIKIEKSATPRVKLI